MVMPTQARRDQLLYKEIHAQWPKRFWGGRGNSARSL